MKVLIDKIVITLTQEGNTLSTPGSHEEMEITLESALGSIDDGGGFMVIKTSGWSLDSSDEFTELLGRVKTVNLGKIIDG